MADTLSGRQATEALLEETAVGLIREQGVLDGLNLQEVADRAGVNRGLIYHYYGSRGTLLRHAFERRVRPLLDFAESVHGLPLQQRLQQQFAAVLRHSSLVRLATLLVLDGNEELQVMPRRRQTQRELGRDVAEGHLDPTVDRKAFNALIPAAWYGYAVFRKPFAAELGLTVEQLDRRVQALFDRILEGLRP